MTEPQTLSRRSPWPVLRTGLLFALASAFALGAAPGWAGAPPALPEKKEVETASWAVLDAVTTIGLDAETLSGLGLKVTTRAPSGRAHRRTRCPSCPPRRRRSRPRAPSTCAPPSRPTVSTASKAVRSASAAASSWAATAARSTCSSLVLRPGRKTTALELVERRGYGAAHHGGRAVGIRCQDRPAPLPERGPADPARSRRASWATSATPA